MVVKYRFEEIFDSEVHLTCVDSSSNQVISYNKCVSNVTFVDVTFFNSNKTAIYGSPQM